MCFDKNINGNRDVRFLIGIIGQCTGERNFLTEYLSVQLPFEVPFQKLVQLLLELEVI